MIQLETAAGAAIKNFRGALGSVCTPAHVCDRHMHVYIRMDASGIKELINTIVETLSWLTFQLLFVQCGQIPLSLHYALCCLCAGINVPRSRFLPVKTTSDLLVVMSNLFELKNGTLVQNPDRLYPELPLVKLGEQFFMKVRRTQQVAK